jgi:hypothetical protein
VRPSVSSRADASIPAFSTSHDWVGSVCDTGVFAPSRNERYRKKRWEEVRKRKGNQGRRCKASFSLFQTNLEWMSDVPVNQS